MNSRLSLETDDTVRILRKADILEILKVWSTSRTAAARSTTSTTSATGAFRSVGELLENQYRPRPAAHGACDPRAHELGPRSTR
jgi:DNA-directed RNA polymerase subunit beta